MGADISRCHQCGARQASLGSRVIPLHSPLHGKDAELELSYRLLPVAFVAGILACAAIALWTLYRFHRWPF